MVQQTSLASAEYDKDVNEFVKAGFTEIASEMVRPPRVSESPVQMECKVLNVVSLGEEGGAGNLVICQVMKLHIKEDILDASGNIDPVKIDTVARMGGNWYSRAKEGMFEVPKPIATLGIGVDAIPEAIRLSSVLTGNDLGMLGNIEALPAADEITDFINASEEYKALTQNGSVQEIHSKAQQLLCEGKISEAWKLLLAFS